MVYLYSSNIFTLVVMKLSIGISPCPNDTYIFDALLHKKIDTEGLDFEVFFEDVETLNLWATQQRLNITKLSYFAYAGLTHCYNLLDAGSALGFGVGPLLIGRKETLDRLHLQNKGNYLNFKDTLKVAIPGKHTTANFLFTWACKGDFEKVEVLFSDIENALLENQVDLGVIIHENRFTYQAKGLEKVVDLGAFWENQTQHAIPLGGIVVSNELPYAVQKKVSRVIQKSILFANANPSSGFEFIQNHAQDMSESVMYQHIALYVNSYSISLGASGQEAVTLLFNEGKKLGLIPKIAKPHFVE